MTKKKKTATMDWYPSKRIRNEYVGNSRELPDVVERPACSTAKMLARQQLQGIEQCDSRTIPVQHDQAFGEVDVLGTICQDGHALMQSYIDSQTTDVKPS